MLSHIYQNANHPNCLFSNCKCLTTHISAWVSAILQLQGFRHLALLRTFLLFTTSAVIAGRSKSGNPEHSQANRDETKEEEEQEDT